MTSMIERGAEAMRARRREMIAQPLDRIWPDLMRAAIEAMLPEWQPIETAPKDGTTVDLWIVSACPEADHQMVDFYSPTARKVSGQPLRHGRVAAVEWRTKRPNLPAWYPAGSLCGYPLSPEVKATHWMRPPAPPADAALRNRRGE